MATGLAGTLIKASNRLPLAGIVVEVRSTTTGAVTATATTDAFGAFAATGLASAAYYAAPRITGQDWELLENVTTASLPAIDHATLTNVTADQHHAQSHTHASHTGVGADDHHSSTSNALAITPASVVTTGAITVGTSLLPDANDGAVLGAAGTAFSDLFLAEGGVINWDSGDATLTQVGNVVTVAGASLALSAGGEDLTLNGATNNRIGWGATGAAAPAFTAYSDGVKLVVWDSITGANAGYAIGIEASNIWFGTATTSTGFKFYGGTTLAASLSGAGLLTVPTLAATDATVGGAAVSVAGHGASDHANRTRNIWLKAEDFTIRAGTPVLAIQGSSTRYSAWGLDAASSETLVTQITMPEDYVSGAVTVKFHWTNLGAGSGNVVWTVGMRNTAAGESLNTVAPSSATDTIAAPAQDILTISTHSFSFTPDAGEQLMVTFARIGGDGADTLANDAGFVGAEIEYPADS